MSILGVVIFAILVVAACYTGRCMGRTAGRSDLPPEISRLL
ncbi:MAG TPA: hypothetical protein PLE99_15910 [Candidatus Thiothrix moscowensis]|nr:MULTISPECIES: hypothetical protein [unclassified Thiothrix]HRJ54245.1 hypothetical protein [Candidatus Thiothrix moscowensis]HRJ94567.1 hypothetical protein [Candidatus Thiothrix moscowensis]